MASIVAAAVLIPFDWSAWRVAAGGLFGVGLAVGLLVLSLNPRRYFRWCLSAWLPLGPLHAAGISFALGARSDTASGFLRWDAQPNSTFLVVWAAIVLALIAADLFQQRRH